MPVSCSRIVEVAWSGERGSSVSSVVGNSRSVITGIWTSSRVVEDEGRWAWMSRWGRYDVGMISLCFVSSSSFEQSSTGEINGPPSFEIQALSSGHSAGDSARTVETAILASSDVCMS